MKKLWCALLIAALVLGAAGCAAKEPAAEADAAESEGGTLEILCLINNLADNNSLNYANAIEERAEELGDQVNITVADSKSDISKQIAQMEDGVTRKVDAIILQPNDAEALGGAIDLCAEAGSP